MRKFDVRLKESSSNHKKKSIIKSILMEDDSARFQENINKIATEMERILIKNSRRPAKTIHILLWFYTVVDGKIHQSFISKHQMFKKKKAN